MISYFGFAPMKLLTNEEVNELSVIFCKIYEAWKNVQRPKKIKFFGNRFVFKKICEIKKYDISNIPAKDMHKLNLSNDQWNELVKYINFD